MKYILLVLCASGWLLASNMEIAQTDFAERVINFVIFVAILWYFVADKLKALLRRRKDDIVARLEEIQNKVKTAKKTKEQAQKQLDEMIKKANEIVAAAKKETELIVQKYKDQYETDAENIDKDMKSLMYFEQRKAESEAIEEILNELLQGDATKISNEDYIKILNRKVA